MQTILVCDDDKQIVEAINIYLTGEGFEVLIKYIFELPPCSHFLMSSFLIF